ncbi:conserved hypothetical protein [Streptomyces sp. SPB78]|nr:conserved hypothetical protein [Streptomyces sp. SPB78]
MCRGTTLALCEISSRLHDGSNPGNRILRSTMRTVTRRNPQLGRGGDGPASVRRGCGPDTYGDRSTGVVRPPAAVCWPRRSGCWSSGGDRGPEKPGGAGRGACEVRGSCPAGRGTGDAARGAYGSCPAVA